jgi:hypothetical protein
MGKFLASNKKAQKALKSVPTSPERNKARKGDKTAYDRAADLFLRQAGRKSRGEKLKEARSSRHAGGVQQSSKSTFDHIRKKRKAFRAKEEKKDWAGEGETSPKEVKRRLKLLKSKQVDESISSKALVDYQKTTPSKMSGATRAHKRHEDEVAKNTAKAELARSGAEQVKLGKKARAHQRKSDAAKQAIPRKVDRETDRDSSREGRLDRLQKHYERYRKRTDRHYNRIKGKNKK